ncbi:hypothetical protein STPYR_12364 [uncultured Stenotrophomonas sp.]|uniref:Uncharacterized protein n=1 Tax=uncultured Stenotrophomonas sp. TaxID=165438 RepID=A0A1Y5QBA5_9GAMM|nr:hypothetical protein STPYR_12364 [uncultured Stenotrophomonas sp.]
MGGQPVGVAAAGVQPDRPYLHGGPALQVLMLQTLPGAMPGRASDGATQDVMTQVRR